MIGVMAIPTLLFLTQSAMISYMLLTGSVSPGDHVFGDGIAPSYLGSYLSTLVSFAFLALLIYANYRADQSATKS